MDILLYKDEGVEARSFRQVWRSLKEEISLHYTFHAVDSLFLLQEKDWEKRVCVLVFPGGRDTPYHQSLRGKANERIRAFVEGGGRFLGICAGAYYGCASIQFEKGFPLEVCAKRELGFFPGVAIGSAYGQGEFCYQSERGARAASVSWGRCDEPQCATIYYNGGCYFQEPEKYENTQVLAYYEDLPKNPAAIIACQVGEGRAVLSGVHPEFHTRFMTRLPLSLGMIQEYLEEREEKRKALWRSLLAELALF